MKNMKMTKCGKDHGNILVIFFQSCFQVNKLSPREIWELYDMAHHIAIDFGEANAHGPSNLGL